MIKQRLPLRCIQRAYMSIKNLPPHSIQRVFLSWLNKKRDDFMVPLRLTKITANGVELHFINYPDCLSVGHSSNGLGVYVQWRRTHWDGLTGYDVYPYQTLEGYKCRQCVSEDGETAALFPTLEALWQDHLFAPFLKWVNEKLAPARWLQISRNSGGSYWAELIQEDSKLSEQDHTLLLKQQLKRFYGKRLYGGGTEDGFTNWFIPLKPETI